MWRYSSFVLTIVMLSSTPLASIEAAPKVSQRWAILVGVNDYAHVKDLHYCVADQLALQKQLVTAGFPEDHIFVLHDKAADAKYHPSQRNIERQLSVVLRLADENDLIVVALSGHGVNLAGKSYFCPADAALTDPTTLISLDTIYDQLRGCAAAFKLVLVDACREDPTLGTPRSLLPNEGTKALARNLREIRLPEGVVLMNSCAPGEISWEEDEFGHGVFMHFVLEALAGEGDLNGDGAVSLDELQKYVGPKTKTYVARRFSDSQRPFVKGELAAEAMEYALLPVRFLPEMARPVEPRPIPVDAKAGEVIANSIGMKLAFIPPGEFLMGSPKSEESHQADELQHRVKISKPFYLGVYEVTQAEYQEVMGTNPSYFSSIGNGKDGVLGLATSRFPVEQVSWEEAQEFCRKLSRKEGKTYRLPTEAEWEYACRAGARSPFHFGAALNSDQANFDGDYPYVTPLKGRDLGRSTLVGSYTANAFGLYDMHGNVWEWCADWFDEDYYRSSPAEDPRGTVSGSSRVNRGGSWSGIASYCRSAIRCGSAPASRAFNLGFRVACIPSGE